MKLDREKYLESASITPRRVLFGLLMLNGFLLIILLFFRKGEIQLSEELSLKFITAEELFHAPEIVTVDVDSVLQDINPLDTASSGLTVSALDSMVVEPELSKRIKFDSNKTDALEAFFKALYKTELDGDLIRILHYGDSQLEGDRISDYLRNKLQQRFGGNGPGIVLPIDVSNSRISIRQSRSPDWKKFAMFGPTKRLKDRMYGLGGSTYQYVGSYAAKIGEDSAVVRVYDQQAEYDSLILLAEADSNFVFPEFNIDSSKYVLDTVITPIFEERDVDNSYLSFRCAKRSYPLVRRFQQVDLLYASKKGFQVYVKADSKDSSIYVPPKWPLGKHRLWNDSVNSRITMSFAGAESPYVFGVSLDGNSGIAVDNFPMRGSSGLGFERINESLFKAELEETNSQLIILQFGINVVPSPRKNYDYYQRMFDAQIKAIKRADPDISILVIGPSDMSRKRNGNYVSYPNIPLIRDAMKNAAFNHGCAFWDLYGAMGGENSMVSWVQNDPPLAGKDFTHFTSRGAQFVGEMLYNAIMSEYINWKKNQNPATFEVQ